MNKDLQEAASFFCTMMPNLDDLHHPMDCSRLLKVVYLAMKNQEEVPLNYIRSTLESQTFSGLNGGTIESFMNSCEEYIEKAKSILDDAQRCGILKFE